MNHEPLFIFDTLEKGLNTAGPRVDQLKSYFDIRKIAKQT